MANPIQFKTLAKRNPVKRALSLRPWKKGRKGKKDGEESEIGDETRSLEVPAEQNVEQGEKQVVVEEPASQGEKEKKEKESSQKEIPGTIESQSADTKNEEMKTEVKAAPTDSSEATTGHTTEAQDAKQEKPAAQETHTTSEKPAIDEVVKDEEVSRQGKTEVKVEIANPQALSEGTSPVSDEKLTKTATNTDVTLENQVPPVDLLSHEEEVGQHPVILENQVPPVDQASVEGKEEQRPAVLENQVLPVDKPNEEPEGGQDTQPSETETKKEEVAPSGSQLDTATLPSPDTNQPSVVDNTPLQRVVTEVQSSLVVEDASSQTQAVSERTSSPPPEHEVEERKQVALETPETLAVTPGLVPNAVSAAPGEQQEELDTEDAEWQIIGHDQAVEHENPSTAPEESSAPIIQKELKESNIVENQPVAPTLGNSPQTEVKQGGEDKPVRLQISPADSTKSLRHSQSCVLEERLTVPGPSSQLYPKSLPSSPVATDPLLAPSPIVRNSPPLSHPAPKAEITPQTSQATPSRQNATRDLSYPPGARVLPPADDDAPVLHLPCLSMPSMFLPVPNVRVVWVSYRVSWWLATPINYLLYPYRAMCRRIL